MSYLLYVCEHAFFLNICRLHFISISEQNTLTKWNELNVELNIQVIEILTDKFISMEKKDENIPCQTDRLQNINLNELNI